MTTHEYRAALQYVPHIAAAVQQAPIPELPKEEYRYILLGIGSRETAWGTTRAYVDIYGTPDNKADDVGDHGHGRGLMQIDDRWHKEFIASGMWKDAFANILYAADLLRSNFAFFRRRVPSSTLRRAAIAAYNCGPGNVWKALKKNLDPDAYTTGKNYSDNVLHRARWYQERLEADFSRPLEQLPLRDLVAIVSKMDAPNVL